MFARFWLTYERGESEKMAWVSGPEFMRSGKPYGLHYDFIIYFVIAVLDNRISYID